MRGHGITILLKHWNQAVNSLRNTIETFAAMKWVESAAAVTLIRMAEVSLSPGS